MFFFSVKLNFLSFKIASLTVLTHLSHVFIIYSIFHRFHVAYLFATQISIINEGAVQVHRLNTEIHDITQLPYWHSNIYCQGVPYTLYMPSRNDLCLSYIFFFCSPLHKGYLMEIPKK